MVMITEQYRQTEKPSAIRPRPRRAAAWSAGRGDGPQPAEGGRRGAPVSRLLSGNPAWFAMQHKQPEGE